MRIIHIIARLAVADGGPTYCASALSQAQAQAGDQVTLLPCSSTGGPMILEPGRYGNLTVLTPPLSYGVSIYDPAMKKIMSEVILDADIIHIHGNWRYHLRAAAAVAEKRHIPYVISPHGNLGRLPRRMKWYLKMPYYHVMNKKIFQRASAIHCCTEKEKKEIMDLKIPARHFVVSNPLPLDSLEPDMTGRAFQDAFPAIPDTAQVVLYLGRIAPVKNVPMLLDAFVQIQSEFPQSHLILAGPHEFQDLAVSLQKRTARAGLNGRVHFPGMVTGPLKTALFRRADVFVLPSLHENFGISAAEAMYLSMPCVVNEGVALAEEIQNCGAGLVFRNSENELASHLRRMLSDGQFRENCSIAARKMAEFFTPEKVALRFREEYQVCIHGYKNRNRSSTRVEECSGIQESDEGQYRGDAMRIVHIISQFDEAGGGPSHSVATLAQAQAKMGDKVLLLPCSRLGGGMVLDPGQYGNLKVMEPPTDRDVILYSAVLKMNIYDVISGADIVHIHGGWRFFARCAAAAARQMGIPYIISPRGNLGRVPRRSKWYFKIPYFYLFSKRKMQKAAAIHCCTQKEKEEIMDLKIPARYFIIPSPLSPDFSETDPAGHLFRDAFPSIPDTARILLYMGRIAPIKNLPLLLEAFIQIHGEFPDVHLILAGPLESGKTVSSMKSRIEEAGLQKRVHFPGMVVGAMRSAIYSRTTLFVQPSRHENFGLSVAEAMYFGLPCVVNKGVALADEIQYFGAGLVFHESIEELILCLRRFLTDDQFRERCSLSAAGAVDEFMPEKVAKKFRKMYRICIEECRQKRSSNMPGALLQQDQDEK